MIILDNSYILSEANRKQPVKAAAFIIVCILSETQVHTLRNTVATIVHGFQ